MTTDTHFSSSCIPSNVRHIGYRYARVLSFSSDIYAVLHETRNVLPGFPRVNECRIRKNKQPIWPNSVQNFLVTCYTSKSQKQKPKVSLFYDELIGHLSLPFLFCMFQNIPGQSRYNILKKLQRAVKSATAGLKTYVSEIT